MNNKLRTTNYESRATSNERRGFTLIELVVSVALIVMVLVFAGSIFKVSIGSYRMASANAEIMQKLRAITEQLNADFKGLRKDAPLLIWFQLDPVDPNNRFDQIMFFADGDFQSTRTYDLPFGATHKEPAATGSPVYSNAARIYYGHAMVWSDTVGDFVQPWQQQGNNQAERVLNLRRRSLARRQHLLTADDSIIHWPNPDSAFFSGSFTAVANNEFEHDSISLSQWQAITRDITNNPTNNNTLITTCFNFRPPMNFRNGAGLYMLMTEGVSSISIQWGYRYRVSPGPPPVDVFFWWPSIDPDGNLNFADSDFGLTGMNRNAFGIYFNLPGGVNPGLVWFPPDQIVARYTSFRPDFFPDALKFTFTLYDSKGVFREGQTFTHIVYLDN